MSTLLSTQPQESDDSVFGSMTGAKRLTSYFDLTGINFLPGTKTKVATIMNILGLHGYLQAYKTLSGLHHVEVGVLGYESTVKNFVDVLQHKFCNLIVKRFNGRTEINFTGVKILSSGSWFVCVVKIHLAKGKYFFFTRVFLQSKCSKTRRQV